METNKFAQKLSEINKAIAESLIKWGGKLVKKNIYQSDFLLEIKILHTGKNSKPPKYLMVTSLHYRFPMLA